MLEYGPQFSRLQSLPEDEEHRFHGKDLSKKQYMVVKEGSRFPFLDDPLSLAAPNGVLSFSYIGRLNEGVSVTHPGVFRRAAGSSMA
jgi:hypothetical protein